MRKVITVRKTGHIGFYAEAVTEGEAFNPQSIREIVYRGLVCKWGMDPDIAEEIIKSNIQTVKIGWYVDVFDKKDTYTIEIAELEGIDKKEGADKENIVIPIEKARLIKDFLHIGGTITELLVRNERRGLIKFLDDNITKATEE